MIAANINHHDEEIKNIVDALYNKSKRTFRKEGCLYEQARYFSPFYRDFILKVIKNNSLKIKKSHQRDGRYYPIGYERTGKLVHRQEGLIEADIYRLEALPHELGHAVDFWFGKYQTLTGHVILSNGRTLKDIFDEELNEKFDDIYQAILDEFKFIVNTHIKSDAYDILMNNIETYKHLKDVDDEDERHAIQMELYKNGFVDVYYQLYSKKWYELLNRKYDPVIDAISSRVNLNSLFLMGHTVEYYQQNDANAVQEFFANLFEAKVTSEHVRFDELRRLLPKSFVAFEELFFMFYDRLQNNKRFTDVKIRRDEEGFYNEL